MLLGPVPSFSNPTPPKSWLNIFSSTSSRLNWKPCQTSLTLSYTSCAPDTYRMFFTGTRRGSQAVVEASAGNDRKSVWSGTSRHAAIAIHSRTRRLGRRGWCGLIPSTIISDPYPCLEGFSIAPEKSPRICGGREGWRGVTFTAE